MNNLVTTIVALCMNIHSVNVLHRLINKLYIFILINALDFRVFPRKMRKHHGTWRLAWLGCSAVHNLRTAHNLRVVHNLRAAHNLWHAQSEGIWGVGGGGGMGWGGGGWVACSPLKF